MRLSIISFTRDGIQLSKEIKRELKKEMQEGMTGTSIAKSTDSVEVTLFTKCSAYFEQASAQGIRYVDQSIGAWARQQMEERKALLFIGACGIAVRAIAPSITDKLHDSPVLVVDEKGQYVIPILAGHVGGANELAYCIAEKIGAKPVITTATDINQAFAVDLFAKKNGLAILNKEGIAKVSAKVLEGKEITVSIECGHFPKDGRVPEGIRLAAYPPTEPVDVVITSKQGELDAALLLKPREYVIGMGCRKGKEADKIEDFIKRSIAEAGIASWQVAALASIDVKSEEEGLLAWSRKEKIPFVTYSAKELQKVNGKFRESAFVREQVGVDNVCERAALKTVEPYGRLVYEKHAEDGMTIAIAKREWRVSFDET